MKSETLSTLRHILDARIDNKQSREALIAWYTARDIIEYALADNTEALAQYDYLLTDEEKEADIAITECDDGFVAEIHSDAGFEAMMDVLFGS